MLTVLNENHSRSRDQIHRQGSSLNTSKGESWHGVVRGAIVFAAQHFKRPLEALHLVLRPKLLN